jgi:hypothetical protein
MLALKDALMRPGYISTLGAMRSRNNPLMRE